MTFIENFGVHTSGEGVKTCSNLNSWQILFLPTLSLHSDVSACTESQYCIVVILCVFVYLICICYTLCVFVISYVYLLYSYVYLLYYVCIDNLALDAGLLARSQYPEGPATGHLDTGFSWFPVSTSECSDGSPVSKLLLHASHVAFRI